MVPIGHAVAIPVPHWWKLNTPLLDNLTINWLAFCMDLEVTAEIDLWERHQCLQTWKIAKTITLFMVCIYICDHLDQILATKYLATCDRILSIARSHSCPKLVWAVARAPLPKMLSAAYILIRKSRFLAQDLAQKKKKIRASCKLLIFFVKNSNEDFVQTL